MGQEARRAGVALATGLALCAWGFSARAQESVQQSTQEQPSLTSARFVFTNFLQGGVAGDGNHSPLLGGKIDAYFVLDGRDVGLWNGFSISAHPEFIYGNTIDEAGFGNILPLNTAMYHPAVGGDDFELSLFATQRFANGASLNFGKINMLEMASRTPVVGGGGLEGFQHLQLAAPISFTTPPYVLGVMLSIPRERFRFAFNIWDARDARNEGVWEEPFSDGVKGFATITFPVTVNGLPGGHGFTAGWSTQENFNLADIPDIIFPNETPPALRTIDGGWQLRYAFQQFLWRDGADPQRGGGVFGSINIWDGNPKLGQWSVQLGVAGSPPIDSRPADRFGVGAFYFQPSDKLRNGLAPVLDLGGEYGAEIFYTWAFSAGLLLTANVEVVEPGPEEGTAVILGLRSNVKF